MSKAWWLQSAQHPERPSLGSLVQMLGYRVIVDPELCEELDSCGLHHAASKTIVLSRGLQELHGPAKQQALETIVHELAHAALSHLRDRGVVEPVHDGVNEAYARAYVRLWSRHDLKVGLLAEAIKVSAQAGMAEWEEERTWSAYDDEAYQLPVQADTVEDILRRVVQHGLLAAWSRADQCSLQCESISWRELVRATRCSGEVNKEGGSAEPPSSCERGGDTMAKAEVPRTVYVDVDGTLLSGSLNHVYELTVRLLGQRLALELYRRFFRKDNLAVNWDLVAKLRAWRDQGSQLILWTNRFPENEPMTRRNLGEEVWSLFEAHLFCGGHKADQPVDGLVIDDDPRNAVGTSYLQVRFRERR